jgi:hypothetical protein
MDKRTWLNPHFKKCIKARHWWLSPVMLLTQEAEIRKTVVGRQLRQIVCEILAQKNPITKKRLLVEWLKV